MKVSGFCFVFSLVASVSAQPPAQTVPATRPSSRTDTRPVNVSVIDNKTRKPVADFQYRYWIEAEQGEVKAPGEHWTRVQSAEGRFLFDAPRSCSINLSVRARDYTDGWGYPGCRAYVLKADNKERQLIVELTPGTTVRGVVKDARTATPIAGAQVCPIIFTPPLFTPDDKRVTRSDESGRFELQGVDTGLGISARHSDYLETRIGFSPDSFKVDKEGVAAVEVRLSPGEEIRGRVQDVAGKPVGDVQVNDGAGKVVRTDVEGSFVLKSPRKWWDSDSGKSYYLEFEKAGYVSETLYPATAPEGGLNVVLRVQPSMTGKVLDQSGKPVSEFEVCAGPGEEPGDWECAYEIVKDADGRFAVRIEKQGPAWLGIKAKGYAFWEARLDTEKSANTLDIRLSPGTVVRGTARFAKNPSGPIKIRIVPQFVTKDRSNDELRPRQKLAMREAVVGNDGKILLENVRPGGYALFIYGRGITPLASWAQVPENGLDLRSLPLQGTGTILGQVHKPKTWEGGTWAFADGYISYAGALGSWHGGEGEFCPLAAMSFKADESGRFKVEDVPVGRASVAFQYNATADVIGAHVRCANVVEGTTTETKFFDPDARWDLSVHVNVGNGSDADWRSGTAGSSKHLKWKDKDEVNAVCALEPLSDAPLSFPVPEGDELRQGARIVIQDVHPGKYRLRVCGPGHDTYAESAIEFKPGAEPVRVNLGAGSVTGQMQWSREFRHYIAVWLVDDRGKEPVRSSSCEEDGGFAFRFVRPGSYTLYAHDHEAGWSRVGPIKVENQMVDIGLHKLSSGGSVSGQVQLLSGKPLPNSIYATHANGVTIDISSWYFKAVNEEKFTFGSLWPGDWTVSLRAGDQILASGNVSLKETENAPVALKWR